MPPKSSDNSSTQSSQRWLWMMPNIAVGMFILAMIALVWVLQKRDFDQQMATLARDVQWTEQTLRVHIQGDQEFLQELAREVSENALDGVEFRARVVQYMVTNPHLSNLAWIDDGGIVRQVATSGAEDWTPGRPLGKEETKRGFSESLASGRPVYSNPFTRENSGPTIELFVPIQRDRKSLGSMVAVYSVQGMLRHLVPVWFSEKYHLSFVAAGGQMLAENSSVHPHDENLTYSLNFDPPGNGMKIRVDAYREQTALGRSLAILLIAGLSLLVVWSLWSLRNNLLRRIHAEDALRTEYNFRKAMEESMPTGMRAIDMSGRITYVNGAFCKMVGYPQEALIGAVAPFPYWTSEDTAEHEHMLTQSLAGEVPQAGIETHFCRANGERFDVRFFEAPLIDSNGKQAGWMASIHDITEQRLARADLEASHQRFTTVLDGLDAAVYVADLDADEILFANRAFKNIYGHDSVGRNCWQVTHACHPDPAHFIAEARGLAAHQTPVELFDTELQNSLNGHWYHLRERAIQWVDGRVVRMETATDITDRMKMEELNNQQLERLQHTSRLITMGEMASSLAHELNQPLSAIANYNMGCVNRLQSNDFRREDLLAAMKKASLQAERAGKIIRRVRDFVRKSEPNRSATLIADIIEEAVGFAEIDARKAGVRVRVNVPADLPAVYADKIMIEQVVLNLVKNGIEAMTDTPREERDLSISARVNGKDFVEVRVADKGHGVLVTETDKLFAPFYTTKPEGMGMGLNICRSIVEFHHGRLWAVPNADRGSVFSFTVPLHP